VKDEKKERTHREKSERDVKSCAFCLFLE
jgi:hypothetical protein